MYSILSKAFMGLSFQYYFRHWLFGLIFPISYVYFITANDISFFTIFICAINTFLYPYSRFLYEKIIDFIIGKNTFFIAAKLFIILKLFTMMLCWTLAVFIAPFGLLYLFFIHSKNQTIQKNIGS